MIIEIAVEIILEYLCFARDNLNKIKLPLTENVDKDTINMTALSLAKSDLNAVIINLEGDVKRKKEERGDDLFRDVKDIEYETTGKWIKEGDNEKGISKGL